MKLKGVIGILLPIILLLLLVDTDLSYDEEKVREYLALNSGFTNEVVKLNDITLSNDNNKDSEVIEYVNNSASMMSIGLSNIDINCTGTGETKAEDEALVKENLNLNVYFTLTPKGEKHSSLYISKKEKVYIHIEKEYIGMNYPQNNVICNYSVKS